MNVRLVFTGDIGRQMLEWHSGLMMARASSDPGHPCVMDVPRIYVCALSQQQHSISPEERRCVLLRQVSRRNCGSYLRGDFLDIVHTMSR
jgi:hypothetical protein